ncbi:MAG: hypothetical protein DMH00_07580 [Acidobacteria bacterium]|nr:MAG: hypothetical protein DMH00_07580 [Acidobacteriota bacterium]
MFRRQHEPQWLPSFQEKPAATLVWVFVSLNVLSWIIERSTRKAVFLDLPKKKRLPAPTW